MAAVFNPQRRIAVLLVFFLVLFVGLGARLSYLQVVRGAYYEAVAESQRKRASELQPNRGTIYVSEGRRKDAAETFPIATNQQAWYAYAIPSEMENPRQVADELVGPLLAFRQRQQERTQSIISTTGQALAVTPTPSPAGESEGESSPTAEQPATATVEELREQLAAKFDRKTDPYEPFLKPYELLDEEFKTFLDERKLPGIVLEEQEVRIYPEKTLAAHLLGYVGYQDEGRIGRYGVEGFFERVLAGDLGFLSSERDTSGKFIGVGSHEFRAAEDGADVVLT
ncbi:MAG: hypothetical protein WD972_01450, partial [Candidatus Andersenbacteria bacterium]